jgi:hypothetical protein
VRILVANSPRLYRESLALAIHRHSPTFEVLIAAPKDLDREVERFMPHALVRDDKGVETEAPEGVVCWAGIIIDNHLNARIGMKGRISEVHDVSLDEFFAALDEAEGLLSSEGGV